MINLLYNRQMKRFQTINQATTFLYSLIPHGTQKLYSGVRGIERTKYLLKLIGSPQNKLKVVHIAGTSGKGSTVYLTSILLKAHGFKVGSHYSPHIFDIRERIQINNEYISSDKFVHYLNLLAPFIEKVGQSKYGQVTYTEALTSLAFLCFQKEEVDFAVIETNLGGLIDMTNSITNPGKIAVITRIGHDHTKILGSTLDKIAAQKAGIIQPENRVVALRQQPQVNRVFTEKSQQANSKVVWVIPHRSFSNVKVSANGTTFDYRFINYRSIQDIVWTNLKLSLLGTHQAENASLAITTIITASNQYKFQLDEGKVRNALAVAHWPGRFEIIQIRGKTIIMDGAHNPQKMASLTKTFKKIFPDQKAIFLISIKHDKNFRGMLEKITGLAQKIYVTKFFTNKYDWVHLSAETKVMAEGLNKLRFKDYEIVEDSREAFQKCLQENNDLIVITGSIYFISEIYPMIKRATK